MNITTLRYFVALQRYRSFAKAAETLFITPQGFGKAIASLESELGVKLVERTFYGVSFTPAGKRFYRHAQKILDDYQDMVFEVIGPETANPHAVTCYTTSFAMEAGNRLMVEMANERGDIIERPFAELDDYLAERNPNSLMFAEIFPSTAPKLHKRKDLVYIPFYQARIGIIWKGQRPFPDEDALSLEDLAKTPVAISSWEVIQRVCFPNNSEDRLTNVRLRTKSSRALVSFTDAPGTASLIDSYSYDLLVGQGIIDEHEIRFTPLTGQSLTFSIGYLYPSAVKLAPECQQYINWTRALVANRFQ